MVFLEAFDLQHRGNCRLYHSASCRGCFSRRIFLSGSLCGALFYRYQNSSLWRSGIGLAFYDLYYYFYWRNSAVLYRNSRRVSGEDLYGDKAQTDFHLQGDEYQDVLRRKEDEREMGETSSGAGSARSVSYAGMGNVLLQREAGKNTHAVGRYLPEDVYVAVGSTVELYDDQVVWSGLRDGYACSWDCEIGENLEDRFRVTGKQEQTGDYPLTLTVYDYNVNEILTSSTLHVVEKLEGEYSVMNIWNRQSVRRKRMVSDNIPSVRRSD